MFKCRGEKWRETLRISELKCCWGKDRDGQIQWIHIVYGRQGLCPALLDNRGWWGSIVKLHTALIANPSTESSYSSEHHTNCIYTNTTTENSLQRLKIYEAGRIWGNFLSYREIKMFMALSAVLNYGTHRLFRAKIKHLKWKNVLCISPVTHQHTHLVYTWFNLW